MANSAIFTVSTNSAVAANGIVPLGTVIRRFGCNTALEGDSITCYGRGYYEVNASVTMTPVAAGTIGVQLYQDGVAVPGGMAYATGTAGEPLSLSFPALVRQTQCGATSLSLRLHSGTATTGATVSNCSVTVEKV